MRFSDAEQEYRNLKTQSAAGQLSEADFRTRLEGMMIEDDQGKWWSIGYETGKWYYHDGEQWVRGDPPADKSTTTPGSVTAAAADVPGVSSTSPTVGPSVNAPGNLAATRNLAGAGALGADAAATPAPAPVPAVTSVAGSSAQAQIATQGRRKPIVTLAIGALLVLILVAGAVVLLSRSGPTAATADAGSGQIGGGAPVLTMTPEVSPTAVAVVAALLTATPTPTDTQSPASLPATHTAIPPHAPTDTLPPPTATPTASPVPDTPTPEPPTPTPEPPTPTVAPTATRRPAPTATRVSAPSAPSATPVPGVVTGFAQWGRWVIGNQPYGTFQQSTEVAHGRGSSARLDYNFPAVKDNYVVFSSRPPLPIPGTPTALSMWVLGDGSGHYLNAWIQDSQGEVRAFTFGTVPEAGTWHKLTAALDTTEPWPQGHISGPDNGKLDYPIKLYALVLDGVPDGTASQGTIYLDDIVVAPGQ